MRMAWSVVFSRTLLGAALALVFLSAPAVVRADASCDPMSAQMQTGYRTLERGQYQDASKAFDEAADNYWSCVLADTRREPAQAARERYWWAYATAGVAAASFGGGDITGGRAMAGSAEKHFREVIDASPSVASEDLRTAAKDGLAYVGSLKASQKPLLPKIWLDWKAAHP